MDTTALTGEAQIRLTLLDNGRPQPGRTVTAAAPPGAWFGINLEPVTSEEDPLDGHMPGYRLLGFDLTLSVYAPGYAEGDLLGAPVPPVGFEDAGRALLARLWELAPPEPPAAFAVEVWDGDVLPGGRRVHHLVPWTTGGYPLDGEVSLLVTAEGALWRSEVWKARARAGAEPWPEDWTPVDVVDGVPVPPRVRPDAYALQSIVSLPPPAADVL
ncbi:hypothetical protein [Streptomyces sp. G1]|uniref:hypothetical protein n=1 Tax=Streptomyces sp. G1 TaxID=361572 RepID=UPI00202EFBEC|nr:hypothetical protein [Streptomyces sp. G1]MCM1964858.1 hypothetical protein [Streptomyces sp. G1]